MSTGTTATTEITSKVRTPLDKINTGDIVAVVKFATVTNKDIHSNYAENVSLKDVYTGQEFKTHGKELIEQLWSADVFTTEESLTLTAMAEKFVECVNVPFTVTFIKKDTTTRTLRGRMINSTERLLGRVMVEDLDIDPLKHRIRQVDLRTITTLIVNGVKYKLK